MMNVYLDVDRTLFRTKDADVLWQLLAEVYPALIDDEKSKREGSNFYVNTENGDYYHAWAKQVESYGISAEEARRVILNSPLADGRLEYEGVGELIAFLEEKSMNCSLITFGEPFYQELKVALCPSLRGIKTIITQDKKDKFFIQHPEPAVLLDDKPIREILPPHVTFVQSVEYNDITPPVAVSWPVARSLDEFRQFLEDMYA